MNKTLVSVAITTAMTSAVVTNPTYGNEAEPTETLVVTANRSVQQAFDVLTPINVFGREEIERISPISLADLLKRVAGVSISANGHAASQTSMFIRGGNSDHMLILVDGVRVGSATLGVKSLGEVNLHSIERVEIVRGPRAALWGSDAISGVVQIFTRQTEAGQTHINAAAGSHGLFRTQVSTSFGNDNHHYGIAVSHEESDGWDVLNPDSNGENDKDGYERQSLALKGQSQLTTEFALDVAAQFDKGETQFDSFTPGNETHYENHMFRIGGQYQLASTQLGFSIANSEDNNHDLTDKIFVGSPQSVYETARDQINLNLAHQISEQAHISAGYDWYEEEVSSHIQYSGLSRTAKAAYVVGRYELDSLMLEGSLRRDDVGETPAQTTYSVGLGYQANDNTLIALNHGKAFKLPTFNDLYWPEGFGSKGNSQLESEVVKNTEFMVRTRGDHLSIEATTYYSDVTNLIEWAYNINTEFFQPSNIANATIRGFELTVDYLIGNVNNRVSLSHIDAKNDETGQQLLRRPHFNAFYEVYYQGNEWDTGIEVNYHGGQNESSGPIGGYVLINWNLGYQWNDELTTRLKISNLANRDYVQAAGFLGPDFDAYRGQERSAEVSLDYRF